MSEQSSGRPTIVAALLISLSIIGGSFFVASSLDRATAQIEQATAALENLPGDGAPSAGRPRPARPDAERKYEVEIGEAPVRGNPKAAVTVVEWSDFQCPFCNRVTPTLAQIQQEYGDRVRIAFKHMPLSIHPQAPAAHAAAEAAHRQGRFWEMHDLIFENQRDLSPETFEGYAEKLGLDLERFRRDVAAADVKKRLDEDMRQASALGITGTPAFFINGRYLSGAQPFANFKRLIDEVLAEES
ncbi:MAG: thioredoxin domain-containing protein [Spirochaetaceae bacterium]|nr:thioredoxin domain-containing protein [Myxococcales bacterium]MCB9724964.1 thioredoxin domain-containing protein [Spirochaetaceae bacterium]HPG25526.1 DsbA family protein [Myxococcota bacterium]